MTRRRKPYTEIGVRRLWCFRCKKRKGQYQWSACADGNNWRPICGVCDVELNQLVLEFMGVPGRAAKMRAYRTRVMRAAR